MSEYSNFSNEYCKGFSKEIYVTTTETDCYSNGLVSRGIDNEVYVGKLSEGATFTIITRNDNEKTRGVIYLGTPDSEFILEAKLNGEDFNVSIILLLLTERSITQLFLNLKKKIIKI